MAGAGSASKSGTPAAWVDWVKIAAGVLLLLVAARVFRSRPHGDEQPQMPKWMATIDKTTPPAALGLGAAMSGANPKNLVLAVGGAAAIAQTGIPGGPGHPAIFAHVIGCYERGHPAFPAARSRFRAGRVRGQNVGDLGGDPASSAQQRAGGPGADSGVTRGG